MCTWQPFGRRSSSTAGSMEGQLLCCPPGLVEWERGSPGATVAGAVLHIVMSGEAITSSRGEQM